MEQHINAIHDRINVQDQTVPNSTNQQTLHEMVEALCQDHSKLLKLLNSQEFSNLNTGQAREYLQHDLSSLEKISSNYTMQAEEEEAKEEGELIEFKEEEKAPIDSHAVQQQIISALDHAEEAINFLKQNLQSSQHQQQQEDRSEEVRKSSSDNSSGSSVLGSASNDSEMLEDRQQEFQEVREVINDSAMSRSDEHEANMTVAQAAEARRDWRTAHIYWLAAKRTAIAGRNETVEYQQINNNVYRHRGLTDQLEERHDLWTQLIDQAEAEAARINAIMENNGTCIIS